MFKTLKSKNIINISILFLFLICIFGFFAIKSRMYTKQLMVQNYRFSINEFVEEVNDSVLKAENNLNGLALIGSLFYRTDRDYELTDRVITRIFENYPDNLGGGIWFKPYSVDKSKKYTCFYAFRDKDNKIIVDKNFESEGYDYLNQQWYKEIISQVTPERNIVWTKPYYENLGSYTNMVTAGTGIYVNGELVGVATVDWELSSAIEKVAKMKPIERTFSLYKKGREIKNSFALFGDENNDYIIATSDPYLDNDKLVGHSLKEIPWFTSSKNLYEITYFSYHGKKYIPFVNYLRNGMILIICIPKLEMFKYVDYFYIPNVLGILFFIFIIFAFAYYGMNRYLINPIDKLINIAHKISKGEDIEIKIEKPAEFAQLASTFNKMTNDIKTITKEKAKIIADLSIAKQIQASSLPSIFPPFPDKQEFDIYASMEPAKEVGGDFYDFYFIDESKFMYLVADVSGKGVPAALFMMTVKTLINNLSQVGYSSSQLIEAINKKVCETNKQGFFVTMLACITDIKTGETSFINCGHNLPLIKRINENYEYLKLNSNMPLGVFEGVEFEIYDTVLNPGDIIYIYTDGVTESTDKNDGIYGEKRLYDCLNSIENSVPIEIAQKVKASVQEYTDCAPQSDDITMLVFKYNGDENNRKIFKRAAIPDNYKNFYTWLHDVCKEWNLSQSLTNKLDMCAEEIFANITFYAYQEKSGIIESELKRTDNIITLEFRDEGIEYNPLEKSDPDINLPPEERPLGGLGIFMVKEMSDEIYYRRENNKNILTLIFKT